jgi:hypothetical protein
MVQLAPQPEQDGVLGNVKPGDVWRDRESGTLHTVTGCIASAIYTSTGPGPMQQYTHEPSWFFRHYELARAAANEPKPESLVGSRWRYGKGDEWTVTEHNGASLKIRCYKESSEWAAGAESFTTTTALPNYSVRIDDAKPAEATAYPAAAQIHAELVELAELVEAARNGITVLPPGTTIEPIAARAPACTCLSGRRSRLCSVHGDDGSERECSVCSGEGECCWCRGAKAAATRKDDGEEWKREAMVAPRGADAEAWRQAVAAAREWTPSKHAHKFTAAAVVLMRRALTEYHGRLPIDATAPEGDIALIGLRAYRERVNRSNAKPFIPRALRGSTPWAPEVE